MPIAHSCEFPTVFEIVEVLKHLGYENPLIEVRPTQRCLCLHASAGRLTARIPHPAATGQDASSERLFTAGPCACGAQGPDHRRPHRRGHRQQLLMKLSEMIPKLKSRKEKPPLDQDGLPPGYPGLQGPMPGMPAEAATPIVSQGSSKKKGKKK